MLARSTICAVWVQRHDKCDLLTTTVLCNYAFVAVWKVKQIVCSRKSHKAQHDVKKALARRTLVKARAGIFMARRQKWMFGLNVLCSAQVHLTCVLSHVQNTQQCHNIIVLLRVNTRSIDGCFMLLYIHSSWLWVSFLFFFLFFFWDFNDCSAYIFNYFKVKQVLPRHEPSGCWPTKKSLTETCSCLRGQAKCFLEKRFYDQTKTKIALFGHNDKSFVWRSKCGAFKPKNTSQAAKHGALGLFCSQ